MFVAPPHRTSELWRYPCSPPENTKQQKSSKSQGDKNLIQMHWLIYLNWQTSVDWNDELYKFNGVGECESVFKSVIFCGKKGCGNYLVEAKVWCEWYQSFWQRAGSIKSPTCEPNGKRNSQSHKTHLLARPQLPSSSPHLLLSTLP